MIILGGSGPGTAGPSVGLSGTQGVVLAGSLLPSQQATHTLLPVHSEAGEEDTATQDRRHSSSGSWAVETLGAIGPLSEGLLETALGQLPASEGLSFSLALTVHRGLAMGVWLAYGNLPATCPRCGHAQETQWHCLWVCLMAW